MKDLGKIIQAISFAYCLAMAVFMFTGPGRISAGLFLMMVGVAGFGFGRFFQSMGEHPIAPLHHQQQHRRDCRQLPVSLAWKIRHSCKSPKKPIHRY